MTKSDLVKLVAIAMDLSKARADAFVDAVFDTITGALRRGERVEIRALGSFEIRHYGSYKGRNPRTGTAVEVKPKRLPFFRVGMKLRDAINPKVTRTQDLPAVREGLKPAAPKPVLRSA